MIPRDAPPPDPDYLIAQLREQGESDAALADLLPVVMQVAAAPRPVASAAETTHLLKALLPLLPAVSPVRQVLRHEQALLTRFLRVARAQVSLLHMSFWLVSAVITLLGIVAGLTALPPEFALTLRAGGPLLAIIAVHSAFRGARQGVLELELSCPLSAFGLTLTRLVIILGYDVLLGLLMSSALAVGRVEAGGLLALTLHWLAPLLLVGGAALLGSLWVRLEIAAGASYGTWLLLLGWTIVEHQQGVVSRLLATGEGGLGLLGLALLILAADRVRAAAPALLPR